MSVGGVGQVQGNKHVQGERLTEAQLEHRIRLFEGVTFDRGGAPEDLASLGGIALPMPSGDQQQITQALFSRATPEQKAELVAVGRSLAALVENDADNPQGLQQSLSEFASVYADANGELGDPHQALQGAMSLAMGSAQHDLYEIAGRLQGAVDRRRDLREDIAELRDHIDAGSYPQEVSYHTMENGEWVESSEVVTNEAEANTFLKELEGALETAGEDMQMLQFDLQEAQQRHTQLLSTMSNISKSWHDAMMAVIRNVK